jgi:hypothetical protein
LREEAVTRRATARGARDTTAGATTVTAPDHPLGAVRKSPEAAAEAANSTETTDPDARHLAAPAAAQQLPAALGAQITLLAAKEPQEPPQDCAPPPNPSRRRRRPTSR